jgi:ribosomal protein L11 methyltransferase
MPYRIDVRRSANDVLERLIELGALDIEQVDQHTIAALMPDGVAPEQVARATGADSVAVSEAASRDAGSVWVLRPRPVQIGRIRIAPALAPEEPGVVRLIDAAAFGTGLHPTTALCLEALDEAVASRLPDAVLDVGTGSGVLALAALVLGVPRACGVDVDDESLRVAAENARINMMTERFSLARGGPEAVTGTWPLVLANVLPASLIEMAPVLVRRIGHHGRLVLSGIPLSIEDEVANAYRRLGMRALETRSNAGWTAVVLQASW